MITKKQLDQLIDSIISRPQMHCQTIDSFDDIMFLLIAIRFSNVENINQQIELLISEKIKAYIPDDKLLTNVPLAKYFEIDSKPSIVDVWKEIKEDLYKKLNSEQND